MYHLKRQRIICDTNEKSRKAQNTSIQIKAFEQSIEVTGNTIEDMDLEKELKDIKVVS